MEFLQMKHHEKQSDWFGKRGLSWHISTVITKNASSGRVELNSYGNIFDSCQQDWYAVWLISENKLEVVKKDHLQITQVSLRSDEAGCYHNNFLLAAVGYAGKQVGLNVTQYDFSEPQYGKKVCDRILCPMNQWSDDIAVRETTFSLQRTCIQRSPNVLFEAQLPATPPKLKCGIPIWKNSKEHWYLTLTKEVFPKVLANWKEKRKC